MNITRSKLISFCRICFVFSYAAIFSGCFVVFTDLPPKSLIIKEDKRLLGRWAGQDQGNRYFVQFDRSNREINISLFGEKSDLGYRNPIFRMVTTKVDGYCYMILRPTDSPDSEGYLIAKYIVTDDKLTIWMLNVDRVKKPIMEGNLRGEIGTGMFAAVTITEGSEKITALLKSPENDLFMRVGEFEKVAAK
jgi:hypothetical protein